MRYSHIQTLRFKWWRSLLERTQTSRERYVCPWVNIGMSIWTVKKYACIIVSLHMEELKSNIKLILQFLNSIRKRFFCVHMEAIFIFFTSSINANQGYYSYRFSFIYALEQKDWQFRKARWHWKSYHWECNHHVFLTHWWCCAIFFDALGNAQQFMISILENFRMYILSRVSIASKWRLCLQDLK